MLPGGHEQDGGLAVSGVVADGSIGRPSHGLHPCLHVCQVYTLDVDLQGHRSHTWSSLSYCDNPSALFDLVLLVVWESESVQMVASVLASHVKLVEFGHSICCKFAKPMMPAYITDHSPWQGSDPLIR